MTTIKVGDISLLAARGSIARMLGQRRGRLNEILRKHGAIIEVKASAITPGDKGFLRRANEAKVEDDGRSVSLTVQNRMKYAVFQHNYAHHHNQPNARDHFIALPFGAELPIMVDEIIKTDMEAVQ